MRYLQSDLVSEGAYPEFVRLTEGVSEKFKEEYHNIMVQCTILHLPTMRLILIMPRNQLTIKGNLLSYKFKQHLPDGSKVDMIAVMLCRDEEDDVCESDVPIIIEQIIKRGVEWSSGDVYLYMDEDDE